MGGQPRLRGRPTVPAEPTAPGRVAVALARHKPDPPAAIDMKDAQLVYRHEQAAVGRGLELAHARQVVVQLLHRDNAEGAPLVSRRRSRPRKHRNEHERNDQETGEP